MTDSNKSQVLLDCTHRRWEHVGQQQKVWSTGYAHRNGKYYSEKSLATCLLENDWSDEFLNSLNGCWAAIKSRGDRMEISVDRSRSIPIMYSCNSDQLLIANCEQGLLEKRPCTLDEVNSMEFLLSTFVTCGQTIHREANHVQPGEKVTFDREPHDWRASSSQYFHFYPKQVTQIDDETAANQLLKCIDATFERLSQRCMNKRPLLPISGGLDSRLIAYYLKKHQVQDVLCYTYGSPKNPQNQIAQSVAEDLGFEWVFVPYNRSVWAKTFDGDLIRAYWKYACNGIASPHMQDFPALAHLSREFDGLDEFVLLPGHVGDAWASEFIVMDLKEPFNHGPAKLHTPYLDLKNSDLVSAIIYRYYNLWPTKRKDWESPTFSAILDKIETQLQLLANTSNPDPRYLLAEWVLRARTAQWITNACRSAEFFGADFALPLGDYDLIDFFRQLGINQLYRRRLYSETVSRLLQQTEFSTLNQVKIMSGVRPPATWKKMLIKGLKNVGLYRSLDRCRRLLKEDKSLNSDSWFSSGRVPELTKVSTALSNHSFSGRLPRSLQGIIDRQLRGTVHSLECNGLLAAIVLGTYFDLTT